MAGPPLEAAWHLVDAWPAPEWSCAVVHGIGGETVTRGDTSRVQRVASVSKPIAAWAVLVAVEEGTVALDDPVGQNGCTLAHLLSHAGGYPLEGAQPVGKPGIKRIYSNSGYDMIASHLEAASGIPFDEYLDDAVLSPLGMGSTSLRGSCAKDIWSNVDDLVALIGELRSPRLVARETWFAAVTPQFPHLTGIVPGIGPADPCPWGLGPEIRGHKSPHWTGSRNSAATFGHFGGIGAFLWVDPVADVGCVMLSETEFTEWGLAHWPAFSDAVLECLGR